MVRHENFANREINCVERQAMMNVVSELLSRLMCMGALSKSRPCSVNFEGEDERLYLLVGQMVVIDRSDERNDLSSPGIIDITALKWIYVFNFKKLITVCSCHCDLIFN